MDNNFEKNFQRKQYDIYITIYETITPNSDKKENRRKIYAHYQVRDLHPSRLIYDWLVLLTLLTWWSWMMGNGTYRASYTTTRRKIQWFYYKYWYKINYANYKEKYIYSSDAIPVIYIIGEGEKAYISVNF